MENKELLTGRCKADFESWYTEFCAKNITDTQDHYQDGFWKDPNWKRLNLLIFYSAIPQNQQGVLLEYFRERGIEIEITKWEDERREYDNIRTNKYYWIIYVDNEFKSLDHECKTYEMQSDYSTTFTTAIQKANEIYNGKELK